MGAAGAAEPLGDVVAAICRPFFAANGGVSCCGPVSDKAGARTTRFATVIPSVTVPELALSNNWIYTSEPFGL